MPLWLTFIVLVIVTTQIANLCTTVYLHRALAHRGLVLKAPVEYTMRVLLWVTTTINRREWVAVHRKHHTCPDREGDPHSPMVYGFWKIQLGNVFYYRRAANDRDMVERFAKDLTPDWLDRFD